jgi:transcriptional regulator with XRE-family HTH domain
MAPWLRQIGRALRIARETKGLSRSQLATAADITRSQLSRYEQGHLMHLATLSRLLQPLDISPNDFFLLVTVLDAPPVLKPSHRRRLDNLAMVLRAVGVRPLPMT